MKTVLTIAGSDSSGGAGIQADIKALISNGVYAMSALTALTAQNTMGVRGILECPCEFMRLQLDAVFEDIFPDAVKIGMLSSAGIASIVAERLKYYGAKNVVVDPVMVSTSGSRLMKTDAVEVLTKDILPLAVLVTPNIPEAEALSGRKIHSKVDMEYSAAKIFDSFGCSVLLKGGHSVCDADDLLFTREGAMWFHGERIDNPNTHGTGCTLSSAITAGLAKGMSIEDAVRKAKAYVSGALSSMLDLGHGSGPLDHGYDLKSHFV